ncbi:MAG: hypothetical protein JRJ65_03850 [Deltaproteobacteria bacterium]|nr:hypothetical protein [Deltaproteobacteria bacterium]
MSAQKDISKKEYLKKTGRVTDGDLPIGSENSGSAYACPYCNTETVFETAATLKDHIYAQHLWNNSSGHARSPIPLCMTIGGIEIQEQLPRRIDEMVRRGFVCDLELNEGVLSDVYTRELADAGFEMELSWDGIEELEGNYEAQLKFISDKKKALEDIIGRPVLGGRRKASHRDKYTYDICDALGFKWYHIRPSITSFPSQPSAPYRAPGHNFALCPRPSLHLWNPPGDVIPYQDSIDGGDYF